MVNSLCFISYFSGWGALVLLFETTFSVELAETITYPGLEGVSLCGTILIHVHMALVRAGYEVSMGHILPHSVLAAITLVGCGAGNGGARATAR